MQSLLLWREIDVRTRWGVWGKKAFYSSAFLFCCLQLYLVLYAWLLLNCCFWTHGTGLSYENWFSWIRRGLDLDAKSGSCDSRHLLLPKMFLNPQNRLTVWRAVGVWTLNREPISLLNDAHRQTRRHGGKTSYFGGSQYDIHSSDCPESKGKGIFLTSLDLFASFELL